MKAYPNSKVLTDINFQQYLYYSQCEFYECYIVPQENQTESISDKAILRRVLSEYFCCEHHQEACALPRQERW